MYKPFNLEEAKQGKLIKLKGNIHPYHLLAVSGSGAIIIENHKGIPAITSQENLEMYPDIIEKEKWNRRMDSCLAFMRLNFTLDELEEMVEERKRSDSWL
jgi:hypothetical protein